MKKAQHTFLMSEGRTHNIKDRFLMAKIQLALGTALFFFPFVFPAQIKKAG